MQNPFLFKINIQKIREEHENHILEKIKNIKDINLTEREKRLIVFEKEIISPTYNISNIKDNPYEGGKARDKQCKEKDKNSEKELIKKIYNNIIKKNKFKINIQQLWEEKFKEKKLIINESNTKENLVDIYYSNENYRINLKEIREEENNKKVDIQIYVNNKHKDINSNSHILEYPKDKNSKECKDPYINVENKENLSISLNDSSFNKLEFSESSLKAEIKEKKFNSLRANFYIKNKLYDIPLIESTIMEFYHPEKFKIDEDYFGFLYPNNLETYSITKSGFLTKVNIKNSNNFINSLGLHFCGKQIKIEGELKRCAPSDFICKECMKKNKKIYNIKINYFININGRLTKKNKGSYHCFGHFLCGNRIEDCIAKFTCRACKMFDSYSKYYL